MKHRDRTLIAALTLLAIAASAEAQAPAGHWQGEIETPVNVIEITVDLGPAKDAGDGGGWIGAIDIPAQGLVDFPLVAINVDGSMVSFAMPGIPGDPVFSGTLDDQGTELAGELAQGGASMPFKLKREGEAEVKVPEAPQLSAERAESLAGRWQGSLETPGKTLRVAFVLAADSTGRLSATFDSLDEGRRGMPVTRLTVDGQTVRAELSYARAAFEGTVDFENGEWSGTWQQGGGSLPLVLRKADGATP